MGFGECLYRFTVLVQYSYDVVTMMMNDGGCEFLFFILRDIKIFSTAPNSKQKMWQSGITPYLHKHQREKTPIFSSRDNNDNNEICTMYKDSRLINS